MIKIISQNCKKGIWVEKISSFYTKNRNPPIKDVFSEAEKDFDITIKRIVESIELDKIDKKSKEWKDLTGDFGEIITCFFLSEKIVFMYLRWSLSPLKTGQGIDIIGLDKDEKKIIVGESKYRNSIKESDIKATAKMLSKQLKVDKIEKIIDKPYNTFQSTVWIKTVLKQEIEKGNLKFDTTLIDEIVDCKDYVRYGSIVRPKSDFSFDFKDAKKFFDDELKEMTESKKDKWKDIILIDIDLEDSNLELKSFLETLRNG